MQAAQGPTRAGPSGNAVMAMLALCGTVVSLQQTLLIPLLPELPSYLHTSAENAAWLVTTTLLAGAVATPVVSRLADMYGKRRMIMITLAVLVLGSLIGTVSTNIVMALVSRVLTGASVALVPVGIAAMQDELPPRRLPVAVALMSATLAIGAGIGLPLAGVLVRYTDWHAIFWVPGVLGLVLLVMLPRIVRESPVRSRGSFDVVGAVMLSGALSACLLALSKGPIWGWSSAPTVASGVVGVALLSLWVPYELQARRPLVDLRTAARPTVMFVNFIALMTGIGLFTNMLVTSQQMQIPAETGFGLGLSTVETGLWMASGAIAFAVCAPLSALITQRFGPQVTLLLGGSISAVAYVLRVFLSTDLWLIVLGVVAVSIGAALAYSAMPTIILRSVPVTETASANGLNTLLRAVGTAVASAAAAAVFGLNPLHVGARFYPTHEALMFTFWLAAAASFLGALAALPLFRVPGLAEADTEGLHDRVLQGVVRDPAGHPVRYAVVTVMGPLGKHVDWGQADAAGAFTVAVPDHGRHLFVVAADGWDPVSLVIDLEPDTTLPDLVVRQQTSVSGTLWRRQRPVVDGSVVVTRRTGEVVGSTRTDGHGSFEVRLPDLGRYVVTGLDRTDGASRAVPVASGAASVRVDIDLPDDSAILVAPPTDRERAGLTVE